MTKSYQYAGNEYNDAAKRQALRTHEAAVEILERQLTEAKARDDREAVQKLVAALKFEAHRNRAKRRKRRRK